MHVEDLGVSDLNMVAPKDGCSSCRWTRILFKSYMNLWRSDDSFGTSCTTRGSGGLRCYFKRGGQFVARFHTHRAGRCHLIWPVARCSLLDGKELEACARMLGAVVWQGLRHWIDYEGSDGGLSSSERIRCVGSEQCPNAGVSEAHCTMERHWVWRCTFPLAGTTYPAEELPVEEVRWAELCCWSSPHRVAWSALMASQCFNTWSWCSHPI